MLSLRDVQRSFAHDLREGTAGALGPHVGAGAFPGERLLQVYRNNTYLSLTEALQSSYPVIAHLVGEGFFKYLAHAFIDRHPPTEGTLVRFGAQLAQFIEQFDQAKQLPYLADVARLEWAWDEVFHEAEHPPFDPASIAEIPSERYGDLRFRLHPATRLLQSQWPIASIWAADQEDWEGDQTIDLSRGGEYMLVARQGLEESVHRLESGPYQLLKGLATGRTLAESLADAAHPDLDLDACLQTWVAHDVIVEASL